MPGSVIAAKGEPEAGQEGTSPFTWSQACPGGSGGSGSCWGTQKSQIDLPGRAGTTAPRVSPRSPHWPVTHGCWFLCEQELATQEAALPTLCRGVRLPFACQGVSLLPFGTSLSPPKWKQQAAGRAVPTLCDDSQVSIFQVSGADPALSISVHPLIMHTFPWGPRGTLSQQPLGSAVPATHRDPLGVPESSYRWQRKCAKPQKSSSLGSPELQAPTHYPPPALS